LKASAIRKLLWVYLLVLVPLAWFSAKFDPYAIDGDAVAYMDLGDLIRAHNWHAVVNGYWHPLYPAFLALAQSVFHPSRWNELGVYYAINVFIFFLEVGGMLLLVDGLVRLRRRMGAAEDALLSADMLRLLGLSLLVISTTRELSLGKVRTDSLLQALIFTGIGLLLEVLAIEGTLAYVLAGAMGITFGLAYLTKSFAFLLTLLSIAVLVLFAVFVLRRGLVRSVVQGAIALICFAVVAGPYVAALSNQHGRFDFGDSGNLNYVWYISGTEKMHLQPRMQNVFGSATVQLKHPEKEILRSPGVYSYTAMTHGTYAPWFDPTYWNDRITPKFSVRLLVKRDVRNVVLIFRYLLNHPEPLLLLLAMCLMGATLRGMGRFVWPALVLGVLVWGIYAIVNVEERYVTAAFLLILMSLFAALKPRAKEQAFSQQRAMALVVLFALLPLGAMAREAAENRRQQSVAGQVPAWRDLNIYGAALGLQQMGLKPGDSIACIGTTACLYDHYWARVAGVRIVSEVYEPNPRHLAMQLDAMQNRSEVYRNLAQTGAKVLVGSFDPGEMNPAHPGTNGWQRLGNTHFYALLLNGNS